MDSEYLKYELKEFNLELTAKNDGSEEVDFIIGNNQIYLQPLNLNTVK